MNADDPKPSSGEGATESSDDEPKVVESKTTGNAPLPWMEPPAWKTELLPKLGFLAFIIVAAYFGSWLGVRPAKSPLGFMIPAAAGTIVMIGPFALLFGIGWCFHRLYRDPPQQSPPSPNQWWLCFRGRPTGPFSFRMLADAFGRNDFPNDSLISRVDSKEWRPRAEWPEWSNGPNQPISELS